MRHLNGSSIIIDDIRQPLHYFLLPKTIGDLLNINTPEIIHEHIDKWIRDGKCDLFLDGLNRKYTFRDAKVDNQVIQNNRYGTPSRDLRISYSTMMNGFIRRK